MKKAAVSDRILDYLTLAILAFASSYSISCLFVLPDKLDVNILFLLEVCFLSLILPCFFKRAAKIAGLILSGIAFIVLLYQVIATNALGNLIQIINTPNYIYSQKDGDITSFLSFVALLDSLFAYFCSKKRAAIVAYWLINAGVAIYVSYYGFFSGIAPMLTVSGCCVLLYIRAAYRVGQNEKAKSGGIPMRAMTAALVLLILILPATQIGYDILHHQENQPPKINIEQLLNTGKNGFQARFTGFSDYDPGRPLGYSIAIDNTPVMKVEADGPFYLRGRIYDCYSGQHWLVTQTNGDDIYQQSIAFRSPGFLFAKYGAQKKSGVQSLTSLYSTGAVTPNPLLKTHTLTVTNQKDGQKYLFAPNSYDGTSLSGLKDNLWLKNSYPDLKAGSPLHSGSSYSFEYAQPDWSSPAVKNALQNAMADTEEFRHSPATSVLAAQYDGRFNEVSVAFGSTKGLSERTIKLAQSITKGCANEFQKADAIEKWLKENCSYTLSPPQPGSDQDFVDYFLFDSKEGYCEHFATAMTMLLRASGVPARYVEGFCSYADNGVGSYEVTNAQAHAWVEYYSYFYGFITADPTPTSSVPRSSYTKNTESSSASSSSSSAVSSAPSSASSSAAVSEPQSSSSSSPRLLSGAAANQKAQSDLMALLKSLLAIGGLLALFALIWGGKALYRLIWLAAVHKKSNRTQALLLYSYFVSVFTKMGLKLTGSMTPEEFADLAAWKFAFGGIDLKRVTTVYSAARFGTKEPTDEELLDFYRLSKVLPAICKTELGKLKYLLMYPVLR